LYEASDYMQAQRTASPIPLQRWRPRQYMDHRPGSWGSLLVPLNVHTAQSPPTTTTAHERERGSSITWMLSVSSRRRDSSGGLAPTDIRSSHRGAVEFTFQDNTTMGGGQVRHHLYF